MVSGAIGEIWLSLLSPDYGLTGPIGEYGYQRYRRRKVSGTIAEMVSRSSAGLGLAALSGQVMAMAQMREGQKRTRLAAQLALF